MSRDNLMDKAKKEIATFEKHVKPPKNWAYSDTIKLANKRFEEDEKLIVDVLSILEADGSPMHGIIKRLRERVGEGSDISKGVVKKMDTTPSKPVENPDGTKWFESETKYISPHGGDIQED